MKIEDGILKSVKMPFCPGCGYNASVRSIAKALDQLGYDHSNVVLVSDIGCSGLIDPLFASHTIHGLHGRSPALGLGVSLGLNDPGKKVVVVQGDGGATIGLQHILEAARRNVNLTLIVLNNLVYGMTGGQISGLSSVDFKQQKGFIDRTPPFDICKLAYSAGAAFVARVNSPGEFEHTLVEAFQSPGFSIVELPSMCQPYGVKKLSELKSQVGPDILLKIDRDPFKVEQIEKESLFNTNEYLRKKYEHNVKEKVGIVISGSAGGGIQSTAKLLASAGIISGLSVSMKGEYPITVGTGFSLAEVILSEKKIYFTGLDTPDVLIVLSEDGLAKVKNRIRKHTIVILDSTVQTLQLESDKIIIQDFVKNEGKHGAALAAVAYWLHTFGTLSKDSLIEATATHKHAQKLLKIINGSLKQDLVI